MQVAYVTKGSLRQLEEQAKQTPTQHILSEQLKHRKEVQKGAQQGNRQRPKNAIIATAMQLIHNIPLNVSYLI